jgi:hypothetical protein
LRLHFPVWDNALAATLFSALEEFELFKIFEALEATLQEVFLSIFYLLS